MEATDTAHHNLKWENTQLFTFSWILFKKKNSNTVDQTRDVWYADKETRISFVAQSIWLGFQVTVPFTISVLDNVSECVAKRVVPAFIDAILE